MSVAEELRTTSHTEDQPLAPGLRVRDLARALVVWAAARLASLSDEIAAFGPTRDQLVRQAGEKRAARLTELDDLTAAEKTRIYPPVATATRVLHSRSASQRITRNFLANHPILAKLLFGLAVVIFVRIVGAYYDEVVTTNTWVVAIAVGLIGWGLLHIMQAGIVRLRRGGAVLRAAVPMFVVAYLLANQNASWHRAEQHWLATSALRTWHWHGIRVSDIRLDAGISAALATLLALTFYRFARALADFILFSIDGQEDIAGYHSAAVLDAFLETALLLQRHAHALVPAAPDAEDEAGTSFPTPYVTGVLRRQLLGHLETIARTAEGSWRREAHTGDRDVDAVIDHTSTGIAVAVRRWKTTAALGGAGLDRMRIAFTTAVINAADGDWQQLAAHDATVKERLAQRAFRWARHTIALGVLVTATVLVGRNPAGAFSWMTMPILVMAMVIAALIDPLMTDRFGGALRLESTLRQPR